VLLANAVLLSSLEGHRPIELPLDEAAYARKLGELAGGSAGP
jgi:hypothetical protein